MFAWKNWHCCAALTAFVGALALAGCGEKKTDAPKAEGDPKPAEPGSPPPKEPTESLANAKPEAAFTAKELKGEHKKDAFFLISKYPGKVVEVTGVVTSVGLDRPNGSLLLDCGEQFEWLRCPVLDKQPWKKVLP